MGYSSNERKQSADDPKCHLCKDPLQRAKILKCCHAFCHACIQNDYVKSGQANVQCPRCREVTRLPSGIIADLPNIEPEALAILEDKLRSDRNIISTTIQPPPESEPVVAIEPQQQPQQQQQQPLPAIPAKKIAAPEKKVVAPTKVMSKEAPAVTAAVKRETRMRSSNSESAAVTEREMATAESRRKVYAERKALSVPAKSPPRLIHEGFQTRNSKKRQAPVKKGGHLTNGFGAFFGSIRANNREVRELNELPWGRDPHDGWGKQPWGVFF